MHSPLPQRRAIADIQKGPTPLVMLTAYTADMARLLEAEVDILLVGDSLGMVLYGFPDTLKVTLDMMIAHGAAVVRSTSSVPVVVDMPFSSYEESPELALQNAQRVMDETGCSAVKLEGGAAMADTIRFLTDNDIPVIGHIGLLPQSIEKMGGFKIQGRDEDSVRQLLADAKAVAEAGVFALVIEGTVEQVAKMVSEAVTVPTIGIGASVGCDGQVLVIQDVLGLTPKPPKFAKAYAHLAPQITEAAKQFAAEVRARTFPDANHWFAAKTK